MAISSALTPLTFSLAPLCHQILEAFRKKNKEFEADKNKPVTLGAMAAPPGRGVGLSGRESQPPTPGRRLSAGTKGCEAYVLNMRSEGNYSVFYSYSAYFVHTRTLNMHALLSYAGRARRDTLFVFRARVNPAPLRRYQGACYVRACVCD